jgi:alkylhydroperoxidase family enzyme
VELNTALGRADGVTEEELRALGNWTATSLFEARERAALAYAEAMATGNTVTEAVFDSVRREFTADEIVELTAAIAWEICAAKFNRALEIEGQGICFIP